MSKTITPSTYRPVHAIARRSRWQAAPALASGSAHIAERAYAAELAHSARAHSRGVRTRDGKPAALAPAREQRAVAAVGRVLSRGPARMRAVAQRVESATPREEALAEGQASNGVAEGQAVPPSPGRSDRRR